MKHWRLHFGAADERGWLIALMSGNKARSEPPRDHGMAPAPPLMRLASAELPQADYVNHYDRLRLCAWASVAERPVCAPA